MANVIKIKTDIDTSGATAQLTALENRIVKTADKVEGGCGDSHARHMRWNKEDCYQEHPGNCPVCRGPMQHVRTLRAAQIYHCPKGNVDFRAECCGYHHYYMTRI